MHFLQLPISQYPVYVLLPVLLIHSEELEGVQQHCFLDFVVEFAVGLEARGLINFKQPWLGIRIDQDVKP